jgi:hypothetical protein
MAAYPEDSAQTTNGRSWGQEQPINGAGQFAPKQPFAGGAVRAGESAKPT